MFLLDTCVLSKGVRSQPDAIVDKWFNAQETSDLFISAMTAAELRYDLDRLPAGHKREGLER